MASRTIELSDRVYDYLLAHSLREAPVLARLRAETASMEGARMQIAPEQGQFMALLVELIGARRTLEVGSYTGYSVWLAEFFRDQICHFLSNICPNPRMRKDFSIVAIDGRIPSGRPFKWHVRI